MTCLWAFQFCEKGSKLPRTALFVEETEQNAIQRFNKWKDSNDWEFNIDKRTVKWGGGSVPLACHSSDEPSIVLYQEIMD
jgi:hypothetical protein